MNAFWEFLLSSLQDSLGKDLGQLVAWAFCLLLILAVAAPLFLVMRAATNLRSSRRDDLSAQDPVGEILNPVISPRSEADLITSLESNAQPVVLPQSSSPELQLRSDVTPQNVDRSGLAAFRYLLVAIVGVTLAGAFLSRLANPANGLVLIPIMFFAIAVAVVVQMGKFRRLMTSAPSINIRRTVTMGEPVLIKLDNDALQKGRDLLNAGNDLDTVCREIEPAYANWGFIEKEAFRKAMEMMLKQSPPAATVSQTTVR